jgi:hypothetical protein
MTHIRCTTWPGIFYKLQWKGIYEIRWGYIKKSPSPRQPGGSTLLMSHHQHRHRLGDWLTEELSGLAALGLLMAPGPFNWFVSHRRLMTSSPPPSRLGESGGSLMWMIQMLQSSVKSHPNSWSQLKAEGDILGITLWFCCCNFVWFSGEIFWL